MTDAELKRIVKILEHKKNIILQGAPGTGKTYQTAAIAVNILGEKITIRNRERIMKAYNDLFNKQIFFTTFHQSLDYESFVEGLKPQLQKDEENKPIGVTYQPVDGIFKIACNAVKNDDKIDICDLIDTFANEHVTDAHKAEIKPLRGNHTLYVWRPSADSKILNVKSSKGSDEASPAGPNIERIKNTALGDDENGENNFISYARAIIKHIQQQNKIDDKPVVLIIDEINRGNISKIFGELITLLENDKRDGFYVNLPYSQEQFAVPSKLYIIGTMNTTDRSTGTIDYALRRRFAFYTLESDPKVVKEHYKSDTTLQAKAMGLYENVKQFIANEDYACGEQGIDDLMIGHSYFLAKDEAELKDKVEFEIIPLIEEYINDGLLSVPEKDKNERFAFWKKLNFK